MSGQLLRLDLMQRWRILCSCKKQSDVHVWVVCWYVYRCEDDGTLVVLASISFFIVLSSVALPLLHQVLEKVDLSKTDIL